MLLLLHALAAVTAATALAAVTAATALAAVTADVTAALALAAVTAAAALPAVTAAEAAFICRVPGFEPEILRPHTDVLSMCYPQTCYI